ncbi:MAG: MMPL family transporter [Lachnospiraceae bacterium]|jgi:predicted RND superfamily exporter protein|nr:MMPL family transporter [Lachnospiraceae bacterium]
MKKFSHLIVKLRIPILILAVALLFPSAIMYSKTRVNYDMLTYLPKTIDTMKGQDIMVQDFGTGAFSMVMVEGMSDRQVADLKASIEKVDHVKDVVWYDSVADLSIPKEMLPDDVYKAFNNGDATMMFVVYDDTSSSDNAVQAVRDIRKICNKQCFISGMTPVIVDTQDLADREAPIYVMLAVLFSAIVLSLSMDSFLVPFIFLASIGFAIVYNMGTNFFLGSISYITKALAAVLQLGVTMDYSIFLWHSYEEELEKTDDHKEAMAEAITLTFQSVIGSSVTTIAGFIALCFMSFTLGMDIGLVMSKGVLLGVISCITILPSLILVFDKALKKTSHKALIPEFHGIGHFVLKHYRLFLVLFLLTLIPSIYGNSHTKVYYNLDESLPKNLESIVANTEVRDKFDMSTNHMLMLNSDIPDKELKSLTAELKKIDGVRYVLGVNTIKGTGIPEDMIPDSLKSSLVNDRWQILIIGSEYKVASDEVNAQCDAINTLAKKYDSGAMLVGEAPGTKDLITISDHDFNTVSFVSIGVIFVIILLVFRSLSLPFILVAVIETGILVNMAVPYYMGTSVPFIANIVIGTIQLGSTVDYAILMTTRYLRERQSGKTKYEAIRIADLTSAKSIFVSALSFFAATFGVGLYSTIDMISSLCTLMARGALISMVAVIFVLPSFLMIFDRLILMTTLSDSDRRKSIWKVLPEEARKGSTSGRTVRAQI